MKRFKPMEETHAEGYLSLENLDLHLRSLGHVNDLGIQVAEDGRVWICVNGVSIIRFRPLE